MRDILRSPSVLNLQTLFATRCQDRVSHHHGWPDANGQPVVVTFEPDLILPQIEFLACLSKGPDRLCCSSRDATESA